MTTSDDEPAADEEAQTEPASSARPDGLVALFWWCRAAHPRQGLLAALILAGLAALTDRADREIALVFVTVLVGQTILGWHNDLVDAATDRSHGRRGKPLSDGRIDAGNVWFALSCAVLALVPLAVTNGVVAGACYLGSVAIGMLGNVVLRRGVLSFVPWALSFALYPYFLSYGGWGADWPHTPPEPAMVVLAALLGVGAHFFWALWGLVADQEDGWRYLPLRVGRKIGATPLLVVTVIYLLGVATAMAYVGDWAGLVE